MTTLQAPQPRWRVQAWLRPERLHKSPKFLYCKYSVSISLAAWGDLWNFILFWYMRSVVWGFQPSLCKVWGKSIVDLLFFFLKSYICHWRCLKLIGFKETKIVWIHCKLYKVITQLIFINLFKCFLVCRSWARVLFETQNECFLSLLYLVVKFAQKKTD